MKAAQINSYGDPSVIHINENTPEPTLKPGQILVENAAASINPFDGKIRAGYLQKMIPLTFPVTLGGDFAGTVMQVAKDVVDFTAGDNVYGQAIILNGGSGTMAELVAANVANTALKPTKLRLEAAAALPLVGVSSLQALEDHMHLQKGQNVLIHGGAGGIGHIAIQVAKALGAYVVATAKTEDVDFVTSLGADRVLDYKTQKFEEILTDFDGVYDTVGGETTDKSFLVLKKGLPAGRQGGILVSMAGQPNEELAKKYGVTAIGQNTKTDTTHLTRLAKLVDSGKITVHVDKVFPLENVQDAFIYQEKIHPRGKVVITM